jgi:hypothetical protein
MGKRTAGSEKRERIRNEFFDDEEAWTGENEKGWFKAPRTLPLILELLSTEELSGIMIRPVYTLSCFLGISTVGL